MKVRYQLRNRARRQAKAAELREAALRRTPEEKLRRLDAGGYTAVSERKKLQALLATKRRVA